MKEIQKAVIIKDNKFLIVLRSPNAKYFPEHWDFPGGKLEHGEDPKEGIKREILEETSLHVEPIDVVGVYEMDLDNAGRNTHRFTVFSTKIISGKVKISFEHMDFKWISKEELLGMKIEPFMKQYLKDN